MQSYVSGYPDLTGHPEVSFTYPFCLFSNLVSLQDPGARALRETHSDVHRHLRSHLPLREHRMWPFATVEIRDPLASFFVAIALSDYSVLISR